MSITERLTSRVFSVHLLLLIWLLYALKNIQAEKLFLFTPQNETTLQRKQIRKVT